MNHNSIYNLMNRLNLLHVDIFYEEFKAEVIEEQEGYEFFQMICKYNAS